MVDTTTLIVISTIVQTFVITVTLIVFVLQFRSQEKAIREASYQGLMGRYNDFIGTLALRPELARLLMDESQHAPTAEEASVFGHLLVAYGIIEEAFLLYKKGWIDRANWEQWSEWLRHLCDRPELRQIHERTKGTFDKQFEEYVGNILKTTSDPEIKEMKNSPD